MKSDADLAHAKEIASAVEPIKHDVHTDSDIGHEDKVFGFDTKMDHLSLPDHKIVANVQGQSFSTLATKATMSTSLTVLDM